MKSLNLLILVVALLAWTLQTRAEPSINGYYLPAIDVPSENPSLAAANIFLSYDDASCNPSFGLPLCTNIIIQNLDGVVYKDGILGFHTSKPEGLGGYYSIVAMDIPYIWSNGKTAVTPSGISHSHSKSEHNLGLGDIEFWPLMPGRIQNGFRYDVRLAIYSPNGQYAAGQLANEGPGYTAFEPQVAFGWLNPGIGMEVSIFSGLGFNKENTTIDYKSGDFFHVDTTVAKHLPFLGGMAGIGINGFYLRQVAADDASGAQPVSIQKRSAGVGPLIFYVHDIGKRQVVFEAKWLPKINVKETTMESFVRVELALNF